MVSSAPSGDRQTRAILLMVLGVGTLSVNDAIIKWLSDGLAVGQILCLRGVIVMSCKPGTLKCGTLRPVTTSQPSHFAPKSASGPSGGT